MQEVDAVAEPDRVGGPSEHGELGRPHALQESGDGCVSWRRRTALSAEADRAESTLDVLDEIVPMRSPRQRSRLVELVGEHRHHIVGVDGRAEPDPGAVALAVEVGRDHELLGREWVGVGQPRQRSGPELELSRPAAAGQRSGNASS
jgi:hypothetical protein